VSAHHYTFEETLKNHCRIIFDNITDGVYTVDLNWRITAFNHAAENITGIARNEAVGRLCSKVLSANMCGNGCILSRSLQTGRPNVNVPTFIVRADKKRIPISATSALLRNQRGEVIGGLVTFRDLSALSRLRDALQKRYSFEDIVSKNAQMRKIFASLPMIARSRSTVLICGESGTGKELLARAIHNHSPMRSGPFVAVNCGALPDTLAESELFGYRAGAFTDAKKDKPGRFAQAENGTLLLDEIGDVSLHIQVRLLRVLEKKVYEPLGGVETLQTNARVVAATHQDLEELVREGRFRKDLYFRINVVKLSLPPLRERKEDIPLLAEHFIERFNQATGRRVMGVSREAMAILMLYDWPGNIRELENTIEHAFVLSRGDLIKASHLPEHLLPRDKAMVIDSCQSLRQIEAQAIEQALIRNQWKRVATARELGIDKNTLRRKMHRYGIGADALQEPQDADSG
jgi:PAS domain S-box-containing protein